MSFDGVEILQRQMQYESNATLQRIKQRAFVLGLDFMGFSTHQGFVSLEFEGKEDPLTAIHKRSELLRKHF